MTDPRRTETAVPALDPLKADRIQFVVLVLPPRNAPYDFASETAAERDARLDAGWRKRTTDASWRTPRAA